MTEIERIRLVSRQGVKVMTTPDICSVCNAFLRVEECWKCCGTGRLRAWLVFSRACPLCSGAGQRALCPDRREHLFASAALRAQAGPGHDTAVNAGEIITRRFARDRVRMSAKAHVRRPVRYVPAATASLAQ